MPAHSRPRTVAVTRGAPPVRGVDGPTAALIDRIVGGRRAVPMTRRTDRLGPYRSAGAIDRVGRARGRSCAAMCSAARIARAAMVRVGGQVVAVTKQPLPTRYRFGTSCA